MLCTTYWLFCFNTSWKRNRKGTLHKIKALWLAFNFLTWLKTCLVLMWAGDYKTICQMKKFFQSFIWRESFLQVSQVVSMRLAFLNNCSFNTVWNFATGKCRRTFRHRHVVQTVHVSICGVSFSSVCSFWVSLVETLPSNDYCHWWGRFVIIVDKSYFPQKNMNS